MAAILNSAMLDSDTAILDSDTLLSSLRFTQKHSHSTLTLTQTNSIFKLIHSDSTWWWQPSWILPSCHLGFSHLFAQNSDSHCQIGSIWLKLIHSDSTWWWQPSWILPCWIQTLPSWIQTPCYLLSDSLKNTLTPLWLWLKLIQSDSNSFILTQLDDGSHLEFCHLEFGHLGFSHLSFSSQTHSHLPRLVPTICTKKNLHSFILTQLDDGSHLEFCHVGFSHFGFKKNFTHSFWLNLMMAAILNSAILNLTPSWFSHLRFSLKLTHTCQDWFPPFAQKNFTHSFWLNLMMAAILNSAMLDSDTAILDSDTLLSSLRFTQKHSHSTLTLTQTNSIWLKLIHSHSTWWWQPSWILPWIQPS